MARSTTATPRASSSRAKQDQQTDDNVVHKSVEEHSKLFRDLLLGFVRIHILYHASKEPIFGVGITEELEQHGYRMSPGMLYPLLHNLEAAGFLAREDQIVGGKIRKYYDITPLGKLALDEARAKVIELVEEVTEDEPETRKTREPRSRKKRGA